MKRILLAAFALLILTQGISQILVPAKWQESLSKTKPKAGEEVEISFKATIDENWYLYSSDFDPDLGPMVTTFDFVKNDTYELVGGIIPVNPGKKYDSLWEGEYTYFKKKGEFIQKVKILKDDFEIRGERNYQVCSDVDGKCIPFTDEFEFVGVINVEEPLEDEGSLWQIIILSLGAGFLAVAMPCIYPLIPVTISIFLKQSKNRNEGIKKALFYGLSIIILFSFIGFIFSLIWGLGSLNQLSTNWIFNLAIFTLLIIFALSFFGVFELTLPNSLVTKIDKQADKGGYIGIFFMAATLVVVSFSCTVPIVGSAIISLTQGEIVKSTISMAAFSVAVALPFTLFAIFPAWLNSLPKSGGWMTTLKTVLGLLELALALKFLSVPDLAYHWGILDRPVFLSIWIAIFTFLGFYLLGKIKLKQDDDNTKVTVPRLIFSLLVFSFVIYLIPGLFGAPLKSLAGFLPPLTTHDFNLVEVIRNENKDSGSTGAYLTEVDNQLCEEPKYSDFLHLPHGLEGYFDLDQAIACAQGQGKPIFVDFTGHGCVNCREMEQRVWADPQVLRRLKEDYVVLALYVDDKKKLPKEEWVKSTYDKKLKRTIGAVNADYQIAQFNNNAQPFYIILNENGKKIHGPKAYDLKISNFVKFLDDGIVQFQQEALISSR